MLPPHCHTHPLAGWNPGCPVTSLQASPSTHLGRVCLQAPPAASVSAVAAAPRPQAESALQGLLGVTQEESSRLIAAMPDLANVKVGAAPATATKAAVQALFRRCPLLLLRCFIYCNKPCRQLPSGWLL